MSEATEKETQSTDLSALIGNLLSNPEALSKMSNIIANIKKSENGDNPPPNSNNININDGSSLKINENEDNVDNVSTTFQNSEISGELSKLPEILSKLSSSNFENSIADKQQIALLLAIRPYLSEHRKELIDTFIKMNHLGSIIKKLT